MIICQDHGVGKTWTLEFGLDYDLDFRLNSVVLLARLAGWFRQGKKIHRYQAVAVEPGAL